LKRLFGVIDEGLLGMVFGALKSSVEFVEEMKVRAEISGLLVPG
jgi:hypothetical protein